MTNKKQFLDYNGLTHLWEKISQTFADKSKTESVIVKLYKLLSDLKNKSIIGAIFTDGNSSNSYEVTDNQLIIKFDDEFVVNSESINALTHKAIAAKFGQLESTINNLPKFSFSIVDELPTAGISSSTIYLVPNSDDTYSEYIYVQKSANEWIWEKVGENIISDSSGLPKSEVEELINAAIVELKDDILDTMVSKSELDDSVLTSINYGSVGKGMSIPIDKLQEMLK